jgi:hypothetical protein
MMLTAKNNLICEDDYDQIARGIMRLLSHEDPVSTAASPGNLVIYYILSFTRVMAFSYTGLFFCTLASW